MRTTLCHGLNLLPLIEIGLINQLGQKVLDIIQTAKFSSEKSFGSVQNHLDQTEIFLSGPKFIIWSFHKLCLHFLAIFDFALFM